MRGGAVRKGVRGAVRKGVRGGDCEERDVGQGL